MDDFKKSLMIGGGLGFVYGGTLLVAMDSFSVASFILFGNRWTIPVLTAITITAVTVITGVSSIWWGPYLMDDIEKRIKEDWENRIEKEKEEEE